MLEALERGNLFLVPLDDRRQWYRYHHLFADVLRARLLDEQPDLRPGSAPAGERLVRAATASGPRRSATRWPPRTSSARPTWSSWRSRRCSGAGRRRRCGAGSRRSPTSCSASGRCSATGTSGSLMATGEFEGVEPPAGRRAVAGRHGGEAPRTGRPTAGDGRRGRGRVPPLPATIAVYRAGQALVLGDRAGSITHARRALDLAGADDHLGARRPSALLGLASWASGDLEAAHAGYAEAWTRMQRAGHIADVLGLAITLARHPDRAGPSRRGDAHVRAGAAARGGAGRAGPAGNGGHARRDGRAAPRAERPARPPTEQLLRSQELGEHLGLPQNPYRWRVAMARIREAEGDLDGALDLLDEAERLYVGDFSPERAADPGDEGAGVDRAGAAGRRPSVGARAGPVRRRRPQLPARVRARHPGQAAAGAVPERAAQCSSGEQALELLERLLQAAEDGGRTGSVIEILVLQALAHQARGDTAGCAGAAGARPGAGRAGGLRPGLRRRGPADGGPARRRPRSAGSPRATSVGC